MATANQVAADQSGDMHVPSADSIIWRSAGSLRLGSAHTPIMHAERRHCVGLEARHPLARRSDAFLARLDHIRLMQKVKNNTGFSICRIRPRSWSVVRPLMHVPDLHELRLRLRPPISAV